MITFTNTIAIDRSVGDVFAYLADLEHVPEWNWAITSTEQVTAGEPEVGTRYLQTRSAPRPATEELEIDVLESYERIEVVGTLAEIPVRLSYELDQVESGTRLTNRVDLQPRGAARFATHVLSGRIESAVAHNLGQLKVRLETGTS
jgi:hypothetical protein